MIRIVIPWNRFYYQFVGIFTFAPRTLHYVDDFGQDWYSKNPDASFHIERKN